MNNNKTNSNKNLSVFFIIAIVVAVMIVLATTFLFFKNQSSGYPEKIEELTLGVERSLLPAAVWVAEEKGYFLEEGIELTIKEFDSGRLSFLSMLEGESIDISTVAPTPIVFSSFERRDFSIVATFVDSYEDVKVIVDSSKGIENISDLKGKRIGTPAGTTGQFFLSAFLVHNGFLDSEIVMVDISPSDLPKTLESGLVDAIVIWEPHAYNARKLLEDRAVRLPSSEIYRETFNFVAMNDFIRQNPRVIEKFLRAINKATDFIQKNKVESQGIVANRLGLDKGTISVLWEDFSFALSFDQSLLLTLEDEARWAIENNLTDKERIPNYLDYIYTDALINVKPEAVSIIR